MAFVDFLDSSPSATAKMKLDGPRLSFRSMAPNGRAAEGVCESNSGCGSLDSRNRSPFSFRKAMPKHNGDGTSADGVAAIPLAQRPGSSAEGSSGRGSSSCDVGIGVDIGGSACRSSEGLGSGRAGSSLAATGSPPHQSREISPQSVLDVAKVSPFHPSRAALPSSPGNSGTLRAAISRSSSPCRPPGGADVGRPPLSSGRSSPSHGSPADSPHRIRVGSPASTSAAAPRDAAVAVAASRGDVLSAVPRKLMGTDSSCHLRHSFEMRKGMDTSSSSNSREDSSSVLGAPSSKFHDLLAASSEEDLANDEALGAFLNKANAAARTRRRQAGESTSYAEQFLSAGPTRRGRRVSCDSNVCEMRPHVDALRGGLSIGGPGAAGDARAVAARRAAAKAIRTALKDGPENRMRLVGAGGVLPLSLCLKSPDAETVEHAAAALLHLSLSSDTAGEVMAAGALRSLVEVLDHDKSSARVNEAGQSNAAACLFALSQNEEYRRLVYAAGVIPHLVAFQKRATTARAKKDACLALFNLAMVPKGAEDMVSEGVVDRTVEILEEAEEGVEEKAAALLGGLAKTPAGAEAIKEVEEDALYALVDTLEGGSPAAAEHAATALHRLSSVYPDVIPKVLAEGCLPPLVRLASQSKKTADSRLLLLLLRDYCAKKAKAEAEAREKDKLKRVRSTQSFARSPSPLRAMLSSTGSGSNSPDLRRGSFSFDRSMLSRGWSGECRKKHSCEGTSSPLRDCA